MNDLPLIVEPSISPMEEWRQRNGLGLFRSLAGWMASTVEHKAHGHTPEEALLNWADKARVKCWKAEELEANKPKFVSEP